MLEWRKMLCLPVEHVAVINEMIDAINPSIGTQIKLAGFVHFDTQRIGHRNSTDSE